MESLHASVVDQVRSRLGATLKGQWHLDALIGVGGMAAVYAATNRRGERAAIKVLHGALSINDSIRKRFAQEGYVANTIGHRGVARVLDDGVTSDGAAFIVMELLEGETAAARAQRNGGKLAVHEVAYVGEAVAEVLAAAHASRVIHRDIKPDNVFITHEGRVVLLDFGIARIESASGVTEAATRTGTMMGTPAFMPPEQARGRANEMDATSDVWALGATLFWLAAGRVVHEAETPNEQLVAAATLPPVSLLRAAPDVPVPLVTVIDKALEFAKENRFRDAVAMKDALHAAVLAISWQPGAAPGLDATIADSPYTSLASKLPRYGIDDATTLAEKKHAIPTIGPVEVGTAVATSRYWRAAGIGAAVAAVVLALAFVVGKTMMPASPDLAAAPSAPVATQSASASASATNVSVASAPVSTASAVASIPSATVTPTVSADTTGVHAVPAGTRKNWLDRRK